MKIAYIVMGFPVVSETFILNQITGMMDKGHSVDIYARFKSANISITHPDYNHYNLKNKTTYLDEIPDNPLLRLSLVFLIIIKSFKKNPLLILRSLNFLKYGRYALSLRLLLHASLFIKGYNYDIIHCHFGHNGKFGLILNELGIKGKLIITFHGYDVNKILHERNYDYYKGLFNHNCIFTVNSEFLKRQLIKLGCPEDNIHIIPAGLRINNFKYKPRIYRDGDNIRILTVGRLVQEKGIIYMLEAIGILKNKYPNIEYTIVGYGPLCNQLKQTVEKMKLKNMVAFTGAVDQDKIQYYYEQAHIFVLPSITSDDGGVETQGLVLQEAQACGIPIIASNIGGIPESLLNNESGFLVPEKDAFSLARKLDYLINTHKEWQRMGNIGRVYVSQRYDINSLNSQLENIYHQKS